MNNGINGIKRIAVTSFAMLYLLLALSYVYLLPNYNNLLRSGYYGGARYLVAKAKTGVGSGARRPLMRKLFYATVENKRQSPGTVLFASLVVSALYAFAAAIALRIVPSHGNLSAYAVVHRYAYLQYLTLRL